MSGTAMRQKPYRVLRLLLYRVNRWGVSAGMDVSEAKKVVLCNQLALFLALIGVPYLFVFTLIGAPGLTWASLPGILFPLCVPWLNKKGHTWMSRIALVTIVNISVLLACLWMGRASGAHIALIPISTFPLILFNWHEKRSMIYGVVLNWILLIGFDAFAFGFGDWHALPPFVERLMAITSLPVILGIQLVTTLYFLVGNRQAETALIKARQQANAANEAKSRFLAVMSHEIRAPMNGILGMSGLWMKADIGPEQRAAVETIHASAKDLMAILGDILDLSKIEAGKMRLENISFVLGDVLEDILPPFRFEAGRKGLSLDVETDSGLPARLWGDPTRLKQVLNNLLGNALKFTESGGVTLRIRPDGSPGGGLITLLFEVEDTGTGISEEARSRIFQSFSQAEESTTRKFGGTGLGLSICKQLVELMGGLIGFRGRPERGAIFHFTLPFAVDGAKAVNAAEAKAVTTRAPKAKPPKKGRFQGRRVLVVEDMATNKIVLDGMLAFYGIQVDSASNGVEALEACSLRSYDLVLMDNHMPVMDGIECTRRIRREHGQRVKAIVAVTADAMSDARARCLEAGMNDVLTKPIVEEELERVLVEWLKPAESDASNAGTPGNGADPAAAILVDQDRLLKMSGEFRRRKPDFWKDALVLFGTDADAILEALRAAMETENYPEIKARGHALKGICLTLGLLRMVDNCKDLEACALERNKAACRSRIRALETDLGPSLDEARRIFGAPG
jgi:signal transduction histidine kinase/CheY-like chemotaxis protein